MESKSISIAVLIPCFNEALAIKQVVLDFKHYLPDAVIYVFDNNSTDNTVAEAQSGGAVVCHEARQGKGHVIRNMFSSIDADVYLMVDGDGTYDASFAPVMIAKVTAEHRDMVVASRLKTFEQATYRYGHWFGNKLISALISRFYQRDLTDVLSGYRAFSRRFVKTSPVLVGGFQIETLLTIHALEIFASIEELEVPYSERMEGSQSKLHTWRDGSLILLTILHLFKESKPFVFFSFFAVVFALFSLGLGLPVILEFLDTGLVPRFPTAILASGLAILSMISMTSGIILNSVSRARIEIKRILFLGA